MNAQPGPELSVVIPTFKERENIAEVIKRLDASLIGVCWEVIFVDDDSPDNTAEIVRELGQRDHRVRIVHRINRRGLSTGCVEGMLASTAPYLAVMDADLQHDERLLPEMLSTLKKETLDIVVGSRYVEGGSTAGWDTDRQLMSRFATKMASFFVKPNLKDPMSGFFLLRREVLQATVRSLSGIGFKILLDIFASAPHSLKFKELPYTFRPRHAGVSKLDSKVAWEYLMLIADKILGQYVPVRLISFIFVGGIGVFVHLIVLWLLFRKVGIEFPAAQTAAAVVAMTANFFMNNVLTYRDRRLRGRHLVRGLISFNLVCSVGTLSNVGIATYLFHENSADWLPSALAGIVIGAVWNFAVTSIYTWNRPTYTWNRPTMRAG
jgi:dolichol-phosphate mannosyltransferase